jgi:hypothetical protein
MHLFRDDPNSPPEDINHLADVEIVLTCESRALELLGAIRSLGDPSFLRGIVWELTSHLRLAMDLYSAAGSATNRYDPSIYQRQSLAEDPNHFIHSWTMLICLVCDVIQNSFAADTKLAADLIDCWLRMPYPIFRRLALFGMSRCGDEASASYLRTLLADEEGLLWPHYAREFSPGIVANGCKNLTSAEFERVIERLVAGPPRSMFRSDISDDDWAQLVDGATFAMLEAIESRGLVLPQSGRLEVQRIRTSREREKAHAAENAVLSERSDAARWTDEKARELEKLSAEGVFEWIMAVRARAQTGFQLLERWALRNPTAVVALLEKLSTAQIWDPRIWKCIVAGAASASTATNAMAGLLERAPKATVIAVAPELARWLSYMDQLAIQLTPEFLELWDLVYKFLGPDPAENYESPLMKAMNSPSGQLCRAILEALFRGAPRLGSGLPTSAKQRIERLLDKTESAESTRAVLCAYLYGLHVVDRDWTRERVVPLFDWKRSTAVTAWRSYLHTLRWYPNLISDVKPSFLDALGHRQELVESGRYLCTLLASVAIDSGSSLSEDELTRGIQRLDREGVVEFVDAIVNS